MLRSRRRLDQCVVPSSQAVVPARTGRSGPARRETEIAVRLTGACPDSRHPGTWPCSSSTLVERVVSTLVGVWGERVRERLADSRVVDWGTNPWTPGGYSPAPPDSGHLRGAGRAVRPARPRRRGHRRGRTRHRERFPSLRRACRRGSARCGRHIARAPHAKLGRTRPAVVVDSGQMHRPIDQGDEMRATVTSIEQGTSISSRSVAVVANVELGDLGACRRR